MAEDRFIAPVGWGLRFAVPQPILSAFHGLFPLEDKVLGCLPEELWHGRLQAGRKGERGEERKGGMGVEGRKRAGREERGERKKCPSTKYNKLQGCMYLCPAQGNK